MLTSKSTFCTPTHRCSRVATIARPQRALIAPCRALAPSLLASLAEASEYAERTGTVDAPIEYLVGGAILVTIVSTAIIPLLLKPGQEAADKIFDAREKGREQTSVKKKK